jgi:hypothetical protein
MVEISPVEVVAVYECVSAAAAMQACDEKQKQQQQQ